MFTYLSSKKGTALNKKFFFLSRLLHKTILDKVNIKFDY